MALYCQGKLQIMTMTLKNQQIFSIMLMVLILKIQKSINLGINVISNEWRHTSELKS